MDILILGQVTETRQLPSFIEWNARRVFDRGNRCTGSLSLEIEMTINNIIIRKDERSFRGLLTIN